AQAVPAVEGLGRDPVETRSGRDHIGVEVQRGQLLPAVEDPGDAAHPEAAGLGVLELRVEGGDDAAHRLVEGLQPARPVPRREGDEAAEEPLEGRAGTRAAGGRKRARPRAPRRPGPRRRAAPRRRSPAPPPGPPPRATRGWRGAARRRPGRRAWAMPRSPPPPRSTPPAPQRAPRPTVRPSSGSSAAPSPSRR